MGGCAMIGQSMINVNNGGIGRVAGICAGIFTLLIILLAGTVIGKIPVASLVGVMVTVSWHTLEKNFFCAFWRAFTGQNNGKKKEDSEILQMQLFRHPRLSLPDLYLYS